ncbi:MAG: hypothetical protein A2020_12635 [Lentisphaerae bacterium GWF2_45_14]|nr:MAG: hypothetical protein A2020_12635 [Lentisphaerae bacterium GWF2_45_14]
MNVVYEPKGRAREYSELACNLYMGCVHGCRYCFAPACMRSTAEKWHSQVDLRKNVISLFEKDAEKLMGDKRRILFSFLSDPYQPIEREKRLTRQALEIVGKYRLKSQILTKGCADLISEDLSLMKRVKTQLGITLCFVDDTSRQEWEPNASTVEDRLSILKMAHAEKIFTWVSLEPVVDPAQALEVIRIAAPYVNFWKIGKLNHMKAVEAGVDWRKFRKDVKKTLAAVGASFYIKEDLQNI